MIIIRFPDDETKLRGLGFLATHFSGKSWASGEVLVPKQALAALAERGIRFSVEGPATHERTEALRNLPAAAIQ